jgi:alpha-L-fucosidase 2
LLGLIAYAADDSLLTYSRGGVAGARNSVFAIDGNTGGAAGVAEMLLQSQGTELHLLPALPAAWPDGSVRGLRARGGIEVSLRWLTGRLVFATLKSDSTQERTVRYGDATRSIKLQSGRALRLRSGRFSQQVV